MPFTKKMNEIMDATGDKFDQFTEELLQEKITMDHIRIALDKVKSSVSEKFLAMYEDWTLKHSST